MQVERLTDNTLRVLEASFKNLDAMISEGAISLYDDMMAALERERKRRKLTRVRLESDLEYPAPDRTPTKGDLGTVDLCGVSTDEVRLLHAVSAEIVDYPCLGYGVRRHVELTWDASEIELENRGVELTFLDEFEVYGT